MGQWQDAAQIGTAGQPPTLQLQHPELFTEAARCRGSARLPADGHPAMLSLSAR